MHDGVYRGESVVFSPAVRAAKAATMVSYDRENMLTPINVPDTQADGVRSHQNLESLIPNNARNEQVGIRLTGTYTCTVPGATVQNRGSLLGLVDKFYFNDGGTDQINVDARAACFYANYGSEGETYSVRVGNPMVTNPNLTLVENFPFWFTSPRSATPNELKYVEVNKQAALNFGLIMKRRYSAAGAAGNSTYGLLDSTATVTVTGISLSLKIIYDNLTPPPQMVTFVDEVDYPVSQANANARIDLKGDKYIRMFIVQQDTDQGGVSDIISTAILRGDKISVYGDQGIPWQDLVEQQRVISGGDIIGDYSMVAFDFMRQGRVTAWWNPNQDTNPRLLLNVAPTKTAAAGTTYTNSIVKVTRIGFWQNGACAQPLKYTI